ncbi:polyisoprenoid-binding protein [Paracoccus sp. 11-3]|uniref:Polyisoprenoid-binding protein n=2 Tax=Paracoccus amoyensis TaxID=2760093 RepID=A0A926JCX0_9RHOB|nr:polyisoprenoid-binding protein [Paracoccus amoyensis]
MPASGTYTFDPEHSAISFEYDHNNRLSESYGIIRGVEGTIVLDTENPANSTVEASFPMSNIVTTAPALDEHIRGKDFFNSPDGSSPITFKSTKVDPEGDDEAKVTGDLTINGVTKEVVLDVDFNNYAENPMTKAMTAGFNAETTIKRSDFNLDAFVPMVEDEVEINISVEAAVAQ